MEKKGKATVAVNSTSSGDESSEDNWLPNWSLNLYNALNPTVITTGKVLAQETPHNPRKSLVLHYLLSLSSE